MGYFNYHAKAQNLISSGHCTKAEIVREYHKISPALVLYFDNHPPMPIREYKFFIYFNLLEKKNIKIAKIK